MRLGTGGEYYATPIAIGDHIMIAAERGEVMFVSIKDDKPEIVTRNQFEHGIAATPAVLDGTIYVRTAKLKRNVCMQLATRSSTTYRVNRLEKSHPVDLLLCVTGH